jgi:DNA-binding NarL/FixJ family response regulator
MDLLIVDDDFGCRGGMAMTLADTYPGASISQAASVQEATNRLASHPETALVLVDLNVEDSRGLQTLRLLKRWCESNQCLARLIVVSAASDYDDSVVTDAFSECATGFIAKGISETAFLSAIARTLAGEVVVVKRSGMAFAPSVQLRQSAAQPAFTAQEHIVGGLVADGLSYKEIARKLTRPDHDVVDETVRTHVKNMAGKLRSAFSGLDERLTAKAVVVSAVAAKLVSFRTAT